MNTLVGYSRSSSIVHFHRQQPGDPKWYSGMTGRALCGAKVDVTDRVVGTAAGFRQPVGSCKRCAAVLGQTVKEA